jgi:hypothetical protein
MSLKSVSLAKQASQWVLKTYVSLETYIKQYLPIERQVYKINDDNELEEVTLWYYFILFINQWFINSHGNYMIEYRHQRKKKIATGNYLSVINQVRNTKPQIKAPVYGLIVKINDKLLNNEEKKKLFVHDGNDKISIVYRLYFDQEMNHLEVVCKGKTKVWKGIECQTVRIQDIIF